MEQTESFLSIIIICPLTARHRTRRFYDARFASECLRPIVARKQSFPTTIRAVATRFDDIQSRNRTDLFVAFLNQQRAHGEPLVERISVVRVLFETWDVSFSSMCAGRSIHKLWVNRHKPGRASNQAKQKKTQNRHNNVVMK